MPPPISHWDVAGPKYPDGAEFIRTEVCFDFRDADRDGDLGCRTEWLNPHNFSHVDAIVAGLLVALVVIAAVLLWKRPPLLKVLASAATLAFVILCLSAAYFFIRGAD